MSGGAAAVAADTEHAFEGEGVAAHLFIDPDGREGRAIAERLFARQRVVAIPPAQLSEFKAELLSIFESPRRRDEVLVDCGRRLIASLSAADPVAPRPDQRVRQMIEFASSGIESAVTLSAAAAVAGLSNGRARHLFVEHTGLPFRVYVLWLRLMKAVQVYAAGQSLTEAAHAAGFSDSAHLSRTFRRMFGISADSLRLT